MRAGATTVVPLLLYFACLGYGFMMIEVPLLQRFVLLLGYPVYALAVVLFALLLLSCIGSLLSVRFVGQARRVLPLVLAAIVVIGAGVRLDSAASGRALPRCADLALRIVFTVVLLAPVGLLLGMPYPLGITLLREFGEGLVPWAWGLNGALSVVASVLAIFIGSRYRLQHRSSHRRRRLRTGAARDRGRCPPARSRRRAAAERGAGFVHCRWLTVSPR